MNISTLTAHNSSLFEIDVELEAAFDHMQEEREITGTISDESRERYAQLFAELGTKIDRIAAYLRTQQRKASIAAEEAQRLQQRRRSAEQRVTTGMALTSQGLSNTTWDTNPAVELQFRCLPTPSGIR